MSRRRGGDADEAGPHRRCIVTGAVGAKDAMIRFVLAPDGTVVADVDERLPGRGFWLSARRDVLEKACAKNPFAKAARTRAAVPDDLADQVERRLVRRCQHLMGLARRSRQAVAGFEKARESLRRGRAGLVLEAADGGPEGRGKLARLAADAPVADVLTADELGAAFGRPRSVHVVVAPGRLAEALRREATRLGGLRATPEQGKDARSA